MMEDSTKKPPTGHDHGQLERRVFITALVLVSLLFLYLLKPFFNAVFWACAIGVLFYPLQQYFLRRMGSPNLAALSTLVVCVILVVVPVLFILSSAIEQGTEFYGYLRTGKINPAEQIEHIKQGLPVVQDMLERFQIDLDTLKGQLSKSAISISRYLAENAFKIGQNTAQFFFTVVLMLYVAFFMLRDGASLVSALIRALPLGDERERLLFNKFAEVTRATVKGNLLVAIVQGSLGGLIFWLLGIGGAFLWGVVMTILSLIPLVGAGLVWAPVAIYLFATGQWIEGLILAGFGAGVIGLVDNVLRPILVGRDTKLPDYIVLLSTLGGIALFGMNGFVIGPLIAAMFVAFWQIFMIEFNSPAKAD